MENCTKFIAYLDLLGIKSIASFDYTSYFNCVREFQNSLIDCENNNKHKGRRAVMVHIFSDCAYLESEDFSSISTFIGNLRYQLLNKGIFFNAAITFGTLGTKCLNKKFLRGSIFRNKDTVKVCAMQTKFCGAGIKVDDAIVEMHKDLINVSVTQSCFCKWDEKKGDYSQFIPFYDLMYKGALVSILNTIVLNFIKTAYADKRAARYYFAGMKTCVSQMNTEDIEEYLIELKSYRFHNYIIQCLMPLYFILADRVYDHIEIEYSDSITNYNSLYDYKNEQEEIRRQLDELTAVFLLQHLEDQLEWSRK